MVGIRTIAVSIAALLVIGFGYAKAQPASQQEGTLLHLSATASVPASPDELAANLMAESTSPSAAAAQRRVNDLIADGMHAAHAVPGVEARAVGYSVGPGDEKHTSWIARQDLELRGSNGQVLLDLAGKLQAEGMVMVSLDWQLSPTLRRKTHDEATTAALKELQARAAAAATTLGLHVDHITDVQLNAPVFQPRASFSMVTTAARSAPPQATAASEDVTANVSADVLLRP